MKQWFKKTLAFILTASIVLGFAAMIPGTTLTADAANTGNAQQDVTIFPSETIDGVEWTGRFPTVARLADGSLIAACYWHPVNLHASWTYEDPKAVTKVAFGSPDGKTWSEPQILMTPEILGENGFGVWRDDAGNFYYDAEEAAANHATIQVEPGDPNLDVLPDGTIVFTFFMRAPWEADFYGRELEDASASNSKFTAAATLIMYSKDGGQSWSKPTEIKTNYLTRGVAKRGNIAAYDDGTILIPLYGYDGIQSNAFHGSCVLAKIEEDGSWNFIRETLMWGSPDADSANYTWDNEHAFGVTTLNGQEVTYDLVRCSGNLLISYDRGITWEIAQADVEGNDSYYTGSTHERLQQPSLVNLDGSNKLICTWTQAVGTGGMRTVYGKIYTPGEDWNKTTPVILYKHNTRGSNDIGDSTTIQLTNGELFSIYYDVASRRVGGVFSTVDELTMLRSESELNSKASDWKIYDMDFESYNAGDEVLVQNDLWMSVYGSTKNTVVEENGNKFVSATTWANSGSNACWWFNNVSSDATVSFDFRFTDALTSGWQQLSLGLGGDWNESSIVFNNMAGYTQFGVYNTTLEKDTFAPGNWYSVKIIWDDYKAYVKLWQKGTAEPADFTHTFLNAGFNVESKVFLKTAGGSTNGQQIQLDNICIYKKTNLSIVEVDENTLGYRFDRDVTYELPVPNVVWSSSNPSVVDVDQNGKLSYNGGAGTAIITASCSNLQATKEITVAGWDFIDLDFENDATGDWSVPSTYGMSYTNYNKSAATKTIVEANGNKYLQLSNNAGRLSSELTVPGGPNVTLQFDYKLATTLTSGWHQLQIAPAGSLNYLWQINNLTYSNVRFYNNNTLTNVADRTLSVGANSPWYTAKIIRNGTTCTLMIWEQGKPETVLYNQTVTNNAFTGNSMIIKFNNDGQNATLCLDNMVMSKTASLSIIDNGNSLGYQFAPDVTAETPVPAVTWSSNNESVVKVDANGSLTYVGAGTATVTATCDNLTASKEITVCAVSYDAGAQVEAPATVLVRSGNTVTAPEMADNGDYIFKGWYNRNNAFDFNAPITESVKLTAKWENKNDIYNLTFDNAPEGDYLVQDGDGLWMDRYDKGWSWVDAEKYLVLSGAEGDATVDFWFNNVPNGSILAFDFRMPTASAGWDRLAIAIGSSDVEYSWRFEQWQGSTSVKYPDWDGNEQVVSDAFAIDTWYSVKMYWNGNQVSVKLWEKGTEEPADYTFITWNSAFGADNKVRLNYVTNAQSYLHLDNIHFYNAQMPVVDAWNITLSDNIGLNFAVKVDEELADHSAVEITVEGNTKTVNLADVVKNENGQYLISVELAAAQMTEPVQVKTLLSGAVVEEKTYTVRQYADYILNGDYAENTKVLVKRMLNYGAAAQTYFDYNTGNMANTGYEMTDVPAISEAALGSVTNGDVNGIDYYGASLLFESRIGVRFYFTVTGRIENYTFTDPQGNIYEPVEKGGRYYVEVMNINPNEYDDVIEITVTDGADTLVVGYSPMRYISRKYYGADDAKLVNLVAQMYQYHKAAEVYLNENDD